MLKLNQSASPNQFLSTPDNDLLTFPAGDWCRSIDMRVAGSLSGTNPQYIMSNGPLAGIALNLALFPEGDSTAARRRRLGFYQGTNSVPKMGTTALANGQEVVIFWQREANVCSIYICPILQAAPIDDSAVVTELTGVAMSSAYNGSYPFHIGTRGDANVDRMADQAFGRLKMINRALTKFEMAKIAYGMSLVDLGYTPLLEMSMSDLASVVDTGPNAFPFTVSGTPTVVANPGFGYSAPSVATPVITGVPVITGNVQSGQTVGYTPAAVTGSTGRSQQWFVDGQPVGTASTLALGVADGKSIFVRQFEANTGGSSYADSAPVTVAAAPITTDTLDLIPPPAESISQRINGRRGVPLAGSYSGTTPTAIEYQLYAEDGMTVLKAWASAGATFASGTWFAEPAIPEGGMYRIAVRSRFGSSTLVTTPASANLFGVGDLYIYGGSSSGEKRFDSTSGTGFTAANNVRKYSSAGWAKFGTVGCGILEANGLALKAGVPVGLIDYAYGGSTLAQWITLTHARWTNFRDAITRVGGKLAGALIFVGSNDAAGNLVASRAQHAANLRTLFSRIRAHTDQPDLPILLSGFNRRTSSTTDAQANFVRMAENDVGNDDNVCHVQTLDLLLSGDGVHLSTAAGGFPASASRNVAVFGPFVYDDVYLRGPEIVAMNIDGTSGLVEMVHRNGSDFTPQAGITGFVATDAQGVAIEITAAVRVDATRIGLTFASAPAALTYLAGAAPSVGTPVFDNGVTALPMHAQPGPLAAADTTAPTFQGELAASVTANSITVSWAGTTSADNVAVVRREYRIGGAGQYVAATTAEEGSKSHTFTNLAASTAYEIDVRCVDTSGNVSAALRIVPTTSAAPVVEFNYVRCILASRDGVPHLNLANVDWALFRSLSPASFVAPMAQGRHSMISGSAAFEVAVPAAVVPSGEYMLVLAESNGTMTLASPISVGQ